ncbi:MAG: hypothetical protein WD066_01945, partial [Planctomycetaceae bacterium]
REGREDAIESCQRDLRPWPSWHVFESAFLPRRSGRTERPAAAPRETSLFLILPSRVIPLVESVAAEITRKTNESETIELRRAWRGIAATEESSDTMTAKTAKDEESGAGRSVGSIISQD